MKFAGMNNLDELIKHAIHEKPGESAEDIYGKDVEEMPIKLQKKQFGTEPKKKITDSDIADYEAREDTRHEYPIKRSSDNFIAEDVYEESSEPEPQEEDIFFGDERGKTIVSCSGKVIGTFHEEEEARAFIKRWMEKEKYWPNVWFVSDHGNMHLVTDLGGIEKQAAVDFSSFKKVINDFQIDEATAREVLKLIQSPKRNETAEAIMDKLDELINGSGVEALRHENAHVDSYYGDIIGTYVNTGDTYNPTIVHDSETGEFILTTWGDFYEGWEKEHPEEEDDIIDRLRDNIEHVAYIFFEKLAGMNIVNEEELEDLTSSYDTVENLSEFLGAETVSKLIRDIDQIEKNYFGDNKKAKEEELADTYFNNYVKNESQRKDKELSDAGQMQFFQKEEM